MGFTIEVKMRALVAAARYCCVCHKRAGLNVEVHHIVPKAISHDNSFENAIPLCFDCHADAGHYNDKHPRGTKLTPEELRMHRDTWYRNVKENNIPDIINKEFVRVRYHLIKNFKIFSQIQEAKFPSVWGSKILYLPNEIGRLHQKYLRTHGENYRRCNLCRRDFLSVEDYLAESNEGRYLTSEERASLPIYSVTRLIDDNDKQLLWQKDPITSSILANGVPVEKMAIPLGHFCACSDLFLDEIITRPLWPVFIEITNSFEKAVSINKIQTESSTIDDFSVSNLGSETKTPGEIVISTMQIMPGESIVIPIMTLLGPFSGDLGDSILSTREDISDGVRDTMTRFDISEMLNCSLLLGSSHWPNKINGTYNGEAFSQEIHECDFTKFFVVDRDYMCGSCPHLFERDFLGRLKYIREFIVKGKFCDVIDKYINNKQDGYCELVELENEITNLIKVTVGDRECLRDQVLKMGESVSFYIRRGETLEVLGNYQPISSVDVLSSSSLVKNEMIRNWIRKQFQKNEE